ncbi:hypothetical protein SUGI_0231370 [Cryptomeria japonica]|nr:hypothetical protein SUGI_0231370 [Cryptomeria japonica]
MGFLCKEELGYDKIIFIYDFCSGRWKRGADLPDNRYLFGCSVDSTKRLIYIAGGSDNNDQILLTAAVYSIEEDKWEYLPPMIWGDYACHCVFDDNKLYVMNRHIIGGFVQCYDPNTRLWRGMTGFHGFTYPNLRVGSTCHTLTAFGRLFYSCKGKVIEFDKVENRFHLVGTQCPQFFIVNGMTMWHGQIVICGRITGGGTAFYLFEPCGVGENGQAAKEEKWTLLSAYTFVELGDVVDCCGTLTL